MPDRSFPVLDALIREIEQIAADQPDTLAVLMAALKLAITSGMDPYLLSGVLVEGVVSTLARNVPPERQGEVAVETVRLMRDRLHAYGLI